MLYHTSSPLIQVINIYACGGRLKSLRSFWRLQTAFASDGGSRAATACLRLSLRSSSAVENAHAFPSCLTLFLGDSTNLSAMGADSPSPVKERPHALTSHKTEHTYTRGGRLKSLRSFWHLQTAFASDGGSRAATACLRLSLRSSVTLGTACAFPRCSAHFVVRLPTPKTERGIRDYYPVFLFQLYMPNKKANF